MSFDPDPSDVLIPNPWDKKTGKFEPLDPVKYKFRLFIGLIFIACALPSLFSSGDSGGREGAG